jgi:hypothetical protein
MDKLKLDEFHKKEREIEKLLEELLEMAEQNGFSINLNYTFTTSGSGSLYYNGGGEWAHSTC